MSRVTWLQLTLTRVTRDTSSQLHVLGSTTHTFSLPSPSHLHTQIFSGGPNIFPSPVLAVLVALALGLAGLLLPVARVALLLQPLPALPPQRLVTRVTCDVATRLLRLLVTQRHIPRHTLPRHGLQRGYSLECDQRGLSRESYVNMCFQVS